MQKEKEKKCSFLSVFSVVFQSKLEFDLYKPKFALNVNIKHGDETQIMIEN